MQCPRCQGRLRVLAVITEREPIQRILDVEPAEQLELALA
jgi:hypothetical protein